MARGAGFVLLLLATATVALGSPLCCVLGSGCCKAPKVAAAEPERGCCAHCPKKHRDTPAPKPCDDKGCTCKSDVAAHGHAPADHVPAIALAEAPALLPPAPAARPGAAAAHRDAPSAPAQRSHPLLL
jgi:hypothetical protein